MKLPRLSVLLAMVMAPGLAWADPIEGEWVTMDGISIAAIHGCSDRFCIVMKSGDWPGKEIGRLKASGKGIYSGTVTDPRDEREYSGRATLKGNSLKLTGCALKIFCQTEIWSRR
ncbi:hypothetical protein MesoLj113c_32010 [Mesorhizobium sp. 113-3-9]|uniref:DUF2147 domain-containing protein n=1 Tax=Mesorhizobium sp. 113-3-9 TaxID=2744517 RepID=UPI001927AF40|nr:DUF2147 domain-containing protein [Mesorhizobium sp. 113-3-9]BCG87091.1 hypothetical protein MesoLj113c_32010 [Mesorhizobium sp. 113-3-9]